MDGSQSCEEAVEDRLDISLSGNAIGKKAIYVKMEAHHKFLWCLKQLLLPIQMPNIDKKGDLHANEELEEHVNTIAEMKGEKHWNIALF